MTLTNPLSHGLLATQPALAAFSAGGEPDHWRLTMGLGTGVGLELEMLVGDVPDGLRIYGDADDAATLRTVLAADATLGEHARTLVMAAHRQAVQPSGLWGLDSAVSGAAIVLALRGRGHTIAGLGDAVTAGATAVRDRLMLAPVSTTSMTWLAATVAKLDAVLATLADPGDRATASEAPGAWRSWWTGKISRRERIAATTLPVVLGDDAERRSLVATQDRGILWIDREIATDATVITAHLVEANTTPRVKATSAEPTVATARVHLRHDVAGAWTQEDENGGLALECLTRTGIREANLHVTMFDAQTGESLETASLHPAVGDCLEARLEPPADRPWVAMVTHDLADGRDPWGDVLVCPPDMLNAVAAAISMMAEGLVAGPTRDALLQLAGAELPSAARASAAATLIAQCRDDRGRIADEILGYLAAGYDAAEMHQMQSDLALIDGLLL